VTDSGFLVILVADGSLLHDTLFPLPAETERNGAPAAPAVYDLKW